MAHSYPIWVDVHACIYNSGKSYGIKDTGTQKIKVGSSVKNSELLATVCITKRIDGDKMVFKYSVDDVILKEAHFELKKAKNGYTAGKLIEIFDYLKDKK